MNWAIRDASDLDYSGIAAAHMASIRELGPAAYSPEIVEAWSAGRDADRYRRAASNGVQFFVAADLSREILGFSAAGVEKGVHLAVYVRGTASRLGIGSALLEKAEQFLRDHGVEEVFIDASLNAVPFYLAHHFVSLGQAIHILSSGGEMACGQMKKSLH